MTESELWSAPLSMSEALRTEWWLWIGLLLIFLAWFRGVARAVKQHRLTKALLKLLRRTNANLPTALNPQQERLTAAEQAVSAASPGPSVLITPGRWLRTNLEAARVVMLAIEPIIRELATSERGTLTAILNKEQKLLARKRTAFSPEPGSYVCRHSGYTGEEERKKLIPQIRFHTQGNRAYSRSWCRHCLVGFEDQWEIAVSGGY